MNLTKTINAIADNTSKDHAIKDAVMVVITAVNELISKFSNDNAVKMAVYAALKPVVTAIEIDLKAIAIERGESLEGHGVKVAYRAGAKKYDYLTAVESSATYDYDVHGMVVIIDKHTTSKVDWRKVATEVGAPIDDFFTYGKPSASVKIL
jgi:hypothetical protein